jgi:ionotropic glutamate receptor
MGGNIRFDHQGHRSNFGLEVIELTHDGLQAIGTWNSSYGLNLARLPLRRTLPTKMQYDRLPLQNESFVVLIALVKPYGMLKETVQKLHGNDQYEGFAIDLIQELSRMLGFNYTFKLQEDSVYGSLNKKTGEWNGMLREVMEGRADLAITDLTITSERESAVDFTMPFMILGISILYEKPKKEPPEMFSFMSPFSDEVWLCLGVAFVGVTLSLFVMARLSPAEWDNPYPCIEEPDVLENQFNLQNSVWFAIGALLQQGSEVAPKAASVRIVASMWYFFTLIMVSSYTANLAAFLTIESTHSPFTDVDGLAALKGQIPFGAKKDGSTYNFFNDSDSKIHREMYAWMEANPKYLTTSNDEGVARAIKGKYAFLMESSTIDYITERECKVTRVGGLLDSKGYGIAMKKGES